MTAGGAGSVRTTVGGVVVTIVVVRASPFADQTLAFDAELGAALLGVARERGRLGDTDELVGQVDALRVIARVQRARVAREDIDCGIGVGKLGAGVVRDARIAMQAVELVLQSRDIGRRARRHGCAGGDEQARRGGERQAQVGRFHGVAPISRRSESTLRSISAVADSARCWRERAEARSPATLARSA